jgi:hypothetical protein
MLATDIPGAYLRAVNIPLLKNLLAVSVPKQDCGPKNNATVGRPRTARLTDIETKDPKSSSTVANKSRSTAIIRSFNDFDIGSMTGDRPKIGPNKST